MKRKGELEKMVVEILVAVVCLAFVGILAVQVYRASTNSDAQAAKAFLNSVDAKATALKIGESNNFIFRGVEGWYLKGWSKGESGRPDKCAFASCICVCRDPSAETCQSRNGYCKTLDFEILSVSTAPFVEKGTYTRDPKIPGGKSGDYETTYFPTCVPLLSNFMSFNISKEDKSLKIVYLWNEGNDQRSKDYFAQCLTSITRDV